MPNPYTIHIGPPHYLISGGRRYRCALGRGGLKANKCEGDGATPIGRFPLRRVFYRADRIEKPNTRLKVRALRANDGWCDDPKNSAYNKLITRPFTHSHERLWREDHIYDLIVELGYNDSPVIAGNGSAIFMHVARSGYTSTDGCIALLQKDLISLIETCHSITELIIPATP